MTSMSCDRVYCMCGAALQQSLIDAVDQCPTPFACLCSCQRRTFRTFRTLLSEVDPRIWNGGCGLLLPPCLSLPLSSPSLPLPPLPSLPLRSRPFPSFPDLSPLLRSRTPLLRLGVWGALKFPSGSGRSLAAKRFLVHFELKIMPPVTMVLRRFLANQFQNKLFYSSKNDTIL